MSEDTKPKANCDNCKYWLTYPATRAEASKGQCTFFTHDDSPKLPLWVEGITRITRSWSGYDCEAHVPAPGGD